MRATSPTVADFADVDYLLRKARTCRLEANFVSETLAAKLVALAARYEEQAQGQTGAVAKPV